MDACRYFAFKGTARRMASDLAPQSDARFFFICMAFAEDVDAAIEAGHGKLKSIGYLTATVDGPVKLLPSENVTDDTEQGEAMRDAREHGAILAIANTPVTD